MSPKSEQGPSKPRKRVSNRGSVSTKVIPAKWRDVNSYFNTLDAETYGLKTLAKQIRSHLKPKDVFERIWCDDIIALSWQAHQLRKLKEFVIFEGARDAVSDTLKMASRRDSADKNNREVDFYLAASKYVEGHPLGNKVEKKLIFAGALINQRFHMGYMAKAEELEHIDRLIFANEKRRDDLIDRLEARRG